MGQNQTAESPEGGEAAGDQNGTDNQGKREEETEGNVRAQRHWFIWWILADRLVQL